MAGRQINRICEKEISMVYSAGGTQSRNTKIKRPHKETTIGNTNYYGQADTTVHIASFRAYL